ncbi:hypothetical protein ACUWC3_28415, partial [Klebsiella pneumoniae]|uniref:hypothetical protein n=1 Tax=Klebsiella pneumoniae TaxID=573 RepID=UPI0040558809
VEFGTHQGITKTAYDNLVRARKRREVHYNNHHKYLKLDVNDRVVIKSYILSNKDNKVNAKLAYKYTSPYRISRKISDVSYEVINEDDPTDVKSAHISQLKKI